MKLLAYISIVCAVVLFGGTLYIEAAEDTFQVQQSITVVDAIAPSVPTNLTATAVSSSQINLSWTASTDNYAVAGYRVFRDLGFIATTTSTSYVDSGLSASTTYAYTVEAFDSSINLSGQSATATATTLEEAEVELEAPSGASSGGNVQIKLLNFTVEPDVYSALISFSTNVFTQAVVSWGETADYELGTLAEQFFLTDHSISLENLAAGTNYFFKIVLVDVYGRTLVLENQQFVTTSLPDTNPPSNVTNLKAVGDEEKITLTWNNPRVDFTEVRIVRSDKFYPKDLFDGKVVYEGNAEQFVDTDVVYGTTYYYTVFARDAFGNYSSGAVTKGRLYKIGEIPEVTDLFDSIEELPLSKVHPIIAQLTLLDLDFFQNGKKLPVSSHTIEIDGDRELKISLDYNKVPEILKTITVTLRDPEDRTKTFSFLLRVNKEKTAYEAHIAPLGRSGTFEFGITILDYKNQGLKKLAGVMVATMPALAFDGALSLHGILVLLSEQLPVLLVLLAILVLLYLGYRCVRALIKR